MNKIAALTLITLVLLACSKPNDPKSLIENAKTSIRDNKSNEAIIALKNLIQKSPNNPEARFLLGKVYFSQDQYINAEKEFSKAFELDYPSPEINIFYAQILLRKGELNEAISVLESVSFKAEENKIKALYLKGKSNLNLGNLDQARLNFDQANQVNNQDNNALLGSALLASYNDENKKALSIINKLLEKDSTEPEAWLLKASIESNQKEFQLAAESYTEYIKLRPNNLNVKTLAAHNWVQARNFQQAQSVISELLETTSSHPTVNLLAAQVAMMEQEYERAKKHSLQVLSTTNNALAQMILGLSDYYLGNNEHAFYQLNAISDMLPDNHQVHKVLAVLQLKLGYTEELEETLSNIDKISENDVKLFAELGTALHHRGDDYLALDLFEKASKALPQNTEVKVKKGLLKLINNDPSGINELINAVEVEPSSKEANIALALAYANKNEAEKANEIAKKWLTESPDSIEALILNGSIAAKFKDYHSAKKYLNQAVEQSPTNIIPLFNLAVIYAAEKNFEQSNEYLKQLLKINKEYPNAYRMLFNNYKALSTPNQLQTYLESITADNSSVWPRITLAILLGRKGNYPEAIERLEELTDFENLPREYFSLLTQSYIKNRDYNRIDDLYRAWAAAQPNNAIIHSMHASAKKKLGKTQQALSIIQNAITQDVFKNNYNLLAYESDYLLHTEQVELAMNKAKKLHNINPNIPLVNKILGQASIAQKKYSEAELYLTHAYSLKSDTQIGFYLAVALKEQNKIDKAIKFLTQELEYQPNNNIYKKFLADLYVQESPEQAIRMYEEIIAKVPNEISTLNNLAWLLNQSNEYKRALSFAESAQELAPNNPQILDTLGLIYLSNGMNKKAVETLIQANKLAPEENTILAHLINALNLNNEMTKANSILQQLSNERRKLVTQALSN